MSDDLPAFDTRLNPKASVQLRHIGQEQNPVIVIDDLILDADDLVDQAAEAPWGSPNGTYYPGLNAPLPASYLQTILPVLAPTFERGFGISRQMPLLAQGFFALATWGLEQFGPLQRIPHYDQPHASCLAMVHYLCKEQGGGTAFFRHSKTGYESIDITRRQGYIETIAKEIEIDGSRLTGFAGPETPNFDMLTFVEPVFNRAVLYPSNILHCALFDGARLSDDPRSGRLTANSFFAPRGL